MINLSLQRISQLIKPSTLPWKAIHVAGTNGKGSVCTYLSHILHSSSIAVGRFTSPHLTHPRDSITISNTPISLPLFSACSAHITALDASLNLNCTEFELLTATAFEAFTRAGVVIAVIEVGLGGRLDATNVLAPEQTLCSVVTKVALDHQAQLGGTLAAIAREKAGIIKPGVGGVVCDSSNDAAVREAVSVAADAADVDVVWAAPQEGGLVSPLEGSFQRENLSCALAAIDVLRQSGDWQAITDASIEAGVAASRWPGRLEWRVLRDGCAEALVDGAHNPAAAAELSRYVDAKIRGAGDGVVWVLAASQGKDVPAMVRALVRSGDAVVATGFGAVEGMPWVSCAPVEEIMQAVGAVEGVEAVGHPVEKAVEAAYNLAAEGGRTVVVAGSLYLVGDIIRQTENETS
ncbi:Mur ligase [Geopyxis carbonaria]|nr:Mur ligase [Geopyxis carbonaria]